MAGRRILHRADGLRQYSEMVPGEERNNLSAVGRQESARPWAWASAVAGGDDCGMEAPRGSVGIHRSVRSLRNALAIGPEVERVYGCQGFAAADAHGSVLVSNLWENYVRGTTGQSLRGTGGSRTRPCGYEGRRASATPAGKQASALARSRTWSSTFGGSRAVRHTPRAQSKPTAGLEPA
jgi:hypothetical protein